MFSTNKAKSIQESDLASQTFEICGHLLFTKKVEYSVIKKGLLETINELTFPQLFIHFYTPWKWVSTHCALTETI